MAKMTPEQEAAYALNYGSSRSSLSKPAQQVYDQLLQERRGVRAPAQQTTSDMQDRINSDMQDRINKVREQSAQQSAQRQARSREIASTVRRFLEIMKQNKNPGSIKVKRSEWSSSRGWIVDKWEDEHVVNGRFVYDPRYLILLVDGTLGHFKATWSTPDKYLPEVGGRAMLGRFVQNREMSLERYYDEIMEFIPRHFARCGLDWTDK